MSIIAPEVFRERIERYVEKNPEASVPEVLGRFLVEPTDEQQAFVADVLADDGSNPPSGGDGTEVSA